MPKPTVKSRAQYFLESQPGSRFSWTAKSETREHSQEEQPHALTLKGNSLKEAFTPTRETHGAPVRIPYAAGARRDGSRSVTERYICGTRRNREHWLVNIYRSMTQCREMKLKMRADPCFSKHRTLAENAHAFVAGPAGGPAPRWCKTKCPYKQIKP